MDIRPLTHEQVLSRISEFYHDDFIELTKSRFQSDEQIIWAGNQSYGGSFGVCGSVGYFLMTSDRAIRVAFPAESSWLKTRNFIKSGKYNVAVDIPSSPLTVKEKQQRLVSEALLRNVYKVDRRDIGAVSVSGGEATLVKLTVYLSPDDYLEPVVFYSLQDGQEVYELLQRAMRREIDARREGLVEQLERLAVLHRSKALTDAQYQKALQRLLGDQGVG